MDQESLREVVPTVITLVCCGSVAVGIFAIAGYLKSRSNLHRQIRIPPSDVTDSDIIDLIEIGTIPSIVDSNNNTI